MSTIAATNLKNASSGSNNIVLNSDGTTTIASPSNIIKSGTAVASTSGTSIDFTGIPSWVKRVTVMFNGVSTNGTSNYQVQIGSGSFTTSGYVGSAAYISGGVQASFTAGYGVVNNPAAASVYSGVLVICNITGSIWIATGAMSTAGNNWSSAGTLTLSGTLDRVRITTVNGTDTFDAGTINILYEG